MRLLELHQCRCNALLRQGLDLSHELRSSLIAIPNQQQGELQMNRLPEVPIRYIKSQRQRRRDALAVVAFVAVIAWIYYIAYTAL
jgi:hypothetical protein